MALTPEQLGHGRSTADGPPDVKVWLTPDQIIRIQDCIKAAPDTDPLDLDMYKLLDSLLKKHLNKRGGL